MYHVWTKGDEYSGWQKKDFPAEPAALAEVLAAVRKGMDPLLTQSVPYEVVILRKEESPGEIAQGQAQPNQGAGAASDGEVRRGDAKAA